MQIKIRYIKNEKELEYVEKYVGSCSDVKYKMGVNKEFDKLCMILDFRGKTSDTDELEKRAYKIQRRLGNILLCKIDSQNNVWIEIQQEQDYNVFFQVFVKNGKIKKEFQKSKFVFYIYLESRTEKQSVDEQRLYFFFLILNKYGKDNFSVKVLFQRKEAYSIEDKNWIIGNSYRICVYSTFQLMTGKFNGRIKVGKEEKGFRMVELGKIGKILPAFLITSDSVEVLQKPIDQKIWKKIQNPSIKYTGNMKLEEAIIALCWRYLFKNIDSGEALRIIRERTFQLRDFYRLIEGIPLIALLIFAEYDYYSRIEMLQEYKRRLKRNRIQISDLLDDYQSKQTYEDYCIHVEMVQERMNNKSLLTKRKPYDTTRSFEEIENDIIENEQNGKKYKEEFNKTYGLHMQIVTEVYEAVAISEGLLQLIDNVVVHAKQGLMSMRIHSVDDKTVLKERYPSYFLIRQNKVQARYFLEVRISDLSGSNIAKEFRIKHEDFRDDLGESHKEILDKFSLKSFFEPLDQEQEIWKFFYKNSQNIINHYGLQIFDSIIRSRDGYFSVTSEKETYRSERVIKGEEDLIFSCPGTSYSILLPLDNRISEDKNIYDSMLTYDICQYLENVDDKAIVQFDFSQMKRPPISQRQVFYDKVCSKMEGIETNNGVIVVDVSNITYLEGVVKGILLYLFKKKEKEKETRIRIAFINCKTYQIVEIVRFISLSYDKAGSNDKMEGIQIYIRGENIGEEIIFFGDTLTEVGNNIMKLACMRGTLYDYFQAVEMLLKRK